MERSIRNCTDILTRTQREKAEDMFLVKIANEDVMELKYVKTDYYEKGSDIVAVYLYVKDVTDCSVKFQEDLTEINFRTSNPSFLRLHGNGSNSNRKFAYIVYTRGKVDPAGSSFIVRKPHVELKLKKQVPVRWGSLEMPNVLRGKKMASTSPVNGITSDNSVKLQTVKETSVNGHRDDSELGKEDMNSPAKTQLLGGKSTPLSKKSQSSEPERNPDKEVAVAEHPQQPSSSSKDDESIRNVNKIVINKAEVFGLTGIENYSNNCYINVVTQVLVNIQELKDYFVSDLYLSSLNSNNPLSSGGKVAKAFADITKALWQGSRTAVRPTAIKYVMGKRNSTFIGFQQCDAQEFCASLLDNLHEDLNAGKIDKSAEYPSKDEETPSVNEKPDTAWHSHVRRNDSLVVKLFHGQLVSRLSCASCHKVSYSYDPCAQISLPIAMNKNVLRTIVFLKDPSKRPLLLRLQISSNHAQVWHLIHILEKKIGIPAHYLRVFQVHLGSYVPVFDDDAPFTAVQGKGYVVVCEIKDEKETDVISLPVLQQISHPTDFPDCAGCGKSQEELGMKLKRCMRCLSIAYCSRECQSKHWQFHRNECKKDWKAQIGLPFVINIKRSGLNYDMLKDFIITYANYSVSSNVGKDSESDSSEGEQDENKHRSWPEGATNTKPATHPFLIKVYSSLKSDAEPLILMSEDFKVEKILPPAVHIVLEWQANQNEDNSFKITTLNPPVGQVLDNIPGEGKHSDLDKCTLNDCLSLFMEPERLHASDSWKCPKCKTLQAAKKEMAISYPPPILLLHFKRFTFGDFGQKISKAVDYPVSGLDLSPYIVEETRNLLNYPPTYDLIGVINHKGTMRMGHYTCLVRMLNQHDQDDVGWRFFDDDDVLRIKEDRVVTSDAYVLVYRMRGTSAAVKCEQLFPHFLPLDWDSEGKGDKAAKAPSRQTSVEAGAADNLSSFKLYNRQVSSEAVASDFVGARGFNRSISKEVETPQDVASKPLNRQSSVNLSRTKAQSESSASISESTEEGVKQTEETKTEGKSIYENKGSMETNRNDASNSNNESHEGSFETSSNSKKDNMQESMIRNLVADEIDKIIHGAQLEHASEEFLKESQTSDRYENSKREHYFDAVVSERESFFEVEDGTEEQLLLNESADDLSTSVTGPEKSAEDITENDLD